MGKQFSIAEAKNNLPALIHDVELGPPVELTRRGVPVAVILSKRKYEELTAKQGGFWQKLTALRRQIEQEQIMITDEDFTGLRDRSSGRDVELAS